ncbi:MAG: universal stress protein [Actinobacteria bacterium]|nr:universal stress protein [Actinomycetota bacterium]
MVPKRLLVATDGSPSARAAESIAAGMADLLGECELVVLTVVRERERPARAGGSHLAGGKELEQAQALADEAADRIRGLMRSTQAHVCTSVVHASSTAGAIVEASRQGEESSLIILGNRGHGPIASLALGSVSNEVVHESQCPVLIAKHDSYPRPLPPI